MPNTVLAFTELAAQSFMFMSLIFTLFLFTATETSILVLCGKGNQRVEFVGFNKQGNCKGIVLY
jgi:hypothetical protein